MLDREDVRLRCDRALSGHRRRTVREMLGTLADSPFAEMPPDFYGKGEAIGRLEAEVATLLGKPAAMFSIKGVVAQQAALRTWTDRSRCRNVVLHPRSHIDLDEQGAFERLHGLSAIRLGAAHAPFTAEDLAGVAERVGAVTVELPLRRAGYRLLDWDQVVGASEWCRARGVPFHVDGARLWEAMPFYGRSLAEIGGLADSVYVSFYKGLGALGGAVLAGPEDFIAEARVWQARHCGAPMTAFPFVIGALDGLAHHLPRMGAYWERARGLAAALSALPGVRVVPAEVRVNAFELWLPGDAAALERAHLEVAAESRVWLFGRFGETALPGMATAEVFVGDAAEDLSDAEVCGLVGRVVEKAGALPLHPTGA